MGNKKQGRKQSLQSLLHSQQNRLDKQRQAAQAALVAERKAATSSQSKSSKHKKKDRAPPQRVTIPFRPTDKILLIGEGNFSFARALACCPPVDLKYLPAKNITATSYDSEEECVAKYSDANTILSELRAKGVEVLFNVDATKLEKCTALKGRKWDRIVWNFPHAGI
jgi:25S rRNA (uracil2634-N3)-methyltransferase